jgi:HSP90 family molecular chaperone
VENSPLVENLLRKGYEVLYMLDPIDEYAMSNLERFDVKYKLVNIAREFKIEVRSLHCT